jgi:hypothetical protein
MSVGDTGKIEKTIDLPVARQECARIIIQFYLVAARVKKAATCKFIHRYALSLSEYM